jgi:hypothetical protein
VLDHKLWGGLRHRGEDQLGRADKLQHIAWHVDKQGLPTSLRSTIRRQQYGTHGLALNRADVERFQGSRALIDVVSRRIGPELPAAGSTVRQRLDTHCEGAHNLSACYTAVVSSDKLPHPDGAHHRRVLPAPNANVRADGYSEVARIHV